MKTPRDTEGRCVYFRVGHHSRLVISVNAGRRRAVNAQYDWMKFYEAAVLEPNSEVLLERIRTAQAAIGQRVMTVAIDEAERRAIVKTLNALTVLQRERRPRRICHQCLDAHDLVDPFNGTTFVVRTGLGETVVTLHTRCLNAWADANSFQALIPLRRSHAAAR